MNHEEFRFYSSENDGYRGGFGDYTDPIPTTGGPINEPPHKKKSSASRAIALVLCCALVGGSAGVGGTTFTEVKGGASEDDINGVDAISGGTITSQALEKAIKTWLEAYVPYFETLKVVEE